MFSKPNPFTNKYSAYIHILTNNHLTLESIIIVLVKKIDFLYAPSTNKEFMETLTLPGQNQLGGRICGAHSIFKHKMNGMLGTTSKESRHSVQWWLLKICFKKCVINKELTVRIHYTKNGRLLGTTVNILKISGTQITNKMIFVTTRALVALVCAVELLQHMMIVDIFWAF